MAAAAAASPAAAVARAPALPDAPFPDAQRVLDFWYGAKDSATYMTFRREWFVSSSEFDDDIRAKFATLITEAVGGGLKEWEAHPASLLAKIIVLDQFTRNTGRGTAAAFAGDAEALRLAKAAVAAHMFDALPEVAHQFALMPYMHAEDREVQRAGEEVEWPKLSSFHTGGLAGFVRDHRAMVDRFGRFPYRNEALGRASTPAELEYLAGDLPAFAQSKPKE